MTDSSHRYGGDPDGVGTTPPPEAPGTGAAVLDRAVDPGGAPSGLRPGPADRGVRRFATAVLIGSGAATLPYLWVLWDLWTGSVDVLRKARADGFDGNFYDVQARAMFHGRLNVSYHAIGAEAFVHAGKVYTYFGIFPSVLRMPILAVTHRFDGRLTAPSMLVAWVLIAVFTALLVWRVRILVRGDAELGRMEAASYGLFSAAILAGSVLIGMAADPWVFSEDLTWSVALTLGVFFTLLGMMERPSWTGFGAVGVLTLCANLNRGSSGYACAIGAVLVAVWIGVGRSGPGARRWAVPMLGVAIVSLAAGAAVTYTKFGIFFGLPASDQLVYQIYHLSRIGNGSYFGVHFLPSTIRAYFQPIGLRITRVFPYVAAPAYPAESVGGIPLYGADHVPSVPSSMPLLFAASLWGVVAAWWPRPNRPMGPVRLVMVVAVLDAATVMIYGWLESRFEADLLPLLVLAGAVGLVDVWRRVGHASRGRRRLVVGGIAVLTVVGVVANTAIAATPQATWSNTQIVGFVRVRLDTGGGTGASPGQWIQRGGPIPAAAPPGNLWVSADCRSVLMSNGSNPRTYLAHRSNYLEIYANWIPVQLDRADLHRLCSAAP